MCLAFGIKFLWAILARGIFFLSGSRLATTPPIRRPIAHHPSQLWTSLPPELLDKILSYLPSDGQQSLRNCSLVAKSWLSPCRRHLFKAVYIRTTTLKSWRDNIPPTNDGLLQHVRTLGYISDNRCMQRGCWPEIYVNVPWDYFPSLRQLQHLYLGSVRLPSSIYWATWMFSAFRHTLSQLTLGSCDITTCAFVTLINYFPNLNRLDLACPLLKVDAKSPSPLSRPKLGQLRISKVFESGLRLLDRLSELGLAFDEIIFNDEYLPVSA